MVRRLAGEDHVGPTDSRAATAALIAAAADSKDIVDDACAKKAVAELTRE